MPSAVAPAFPPTPSCQFNVWQWNWYLSNKINPQAAAPNVEDPTQQMTVQQYVQARAAAGLL
jgi:hypothetical protein